MLKDNCHSWNLIWDRNSLFNRTKRERKARLDPFLWISKEEAAASFLIDVFFLIFTKKKCHFRKSLKFAQNVKIGRRWCPITSAALSSPRRHHLHQHQRHAARHASRRSTWPLLEVDLFNSWFVIHVISMNFKLGDTIWIFLAQYSKVRINYSSILASQNILRRNVVDK